MKVIAWINCLVMILASALVTESGSAAPISAPKSFAVFVASYNTYNDVVRGGVCGTVFFVSPTRAITANHVLKASSFTPLPGFERVHVWLVHEGYPAVEIKKEFITSNPNTDVTAIHLPTELKVDGQFVFATAQVDAGTTNVETDGFIASSAGPTLVRQGPDIQISEVTHLSRLHLSGTLIRTANINLKAADIELKESPEVELSFQPIVGISGGPVTSNGKVIAMNSFADPETRQHTWALQLHSSTGLNLLP
jgi:hypothetical protein